MKIITEEDKKLVEKWKPLLDSNNSDVTKIPLIEGHSGKVKLDGSYVPPSSALPPPRQSPHHKLDKNTPSINISKETTKEEKNIKDYKINTRILYCHKRHQTPQFEAIVSEFSDSGEYVCLEYSPNKTNDWYKVTDIIVLDTLKNKQTPVDEVSYEQQEADAIEKECEEYEITKDKMIFYDEVDQKMTEEDWNSFGEYHLSAESYNEWLKKKEKAQEELQKLEVYPSDVIHGKNKPTYFLEIYNGERWKLCLRAEFNFFGWSSGEVHPCTLGEGKIAHEYLINMYTLTNLKRIVDGLNMQNTKDNSPLPPPSFETSKFRNKEKIDWQKNYPYPITNSP